MIEEVSKNNIQDVLPLIREYQQFYGVEKIDEEKNNLFFSQFTNLSNKGCLYLYRIENKAIGFATLYNGFSSTRTEAVAILNDLYVQSSQRRKGYGKALIHHAIKSAKSKGYSRLQWLTAKNNIEAQRLYNSLNTNQSEWFFYAKEI